MDTPPAEISPLSQHDPLPICAVELLASKLHVSPEQLDVKFATGGATTVTACVFGLEPPASVTAGGTPSVPPAPSRCGPALPRPVAAPPTPPRLEAALGRRDQVAARKAHRSAGH